MNLLIQVIVAVAVFIIIHNYLIPLLPAPFGAIAMIVLVVAAIIWLIRVATAVWPDVWPRR